MEFYTQLYSFTLTQCQALRNGVSKASATSMIGCTINELYGEYPTGLETTGGAQKTQIFEDIVW
jgi:hypothetical protein